MHFVVRVRRRRLHLPCLCDDADYITILNTVNGIDCEDDVRLIRRETFKMLHLLDDIKFRYGGDDDA